MENQWPFTNKETVKSLQDEDKTMIYYLDEDSYVSKVDVKDIVPIGKFFGSSKKFFDIVMKCLKQGISPPNPHLSEDEIRMQAGEYDKITVLAMTSLFSSWKKAIDENYWESLINE